MSFLSSIFGGSSNTPQVNFTPTGFNNPTGFGVSGGGTVTQSPFLAANLSGAQQSLQGASTAFGQLAQTVQPGFSKFRQAGLRDITNQFRATRANLQDTLAQRRILGSSFANSQFSQTAADEAQAKADFEASSYIQELQQSQNLIQEQYNAQYQSFATAISQSNIESAAAANLTATNNQIGAQIASANAQLTAQAQAGAGGFLGSLIGAGASLGGSFMTSSATNALAAALLA